MRITNKWVVAGKEQLMSTPILELPLELTANDLAIFARTWGKVMVNMHDKKNPGNFVRVYGDVIASQCNKLSKRALIRFEFKENYLILHYTQKDFTGQFRFKHIDFVKLHAEYNAAKKRQQASMPTRFKRYTWNEMIDVSIGGQI